MADFSVLIGCYGDYPQYSLRAVRSVLDHCVSREGFEVHVGCSEAGQRTLAELQQLFTAGELDSLVTARSNINKDPMMRVLLDLASAQYILWMDDDSHVLPEWDVH